EPRPIEVVGAEAPKHGRGRRKSRQDAREKRHGDGTILLVATKPADLVERAPRKTATLQRRVDLDDIERQHAMIADAAESEFTHPLTQSRQSFMWRQHPAR